MDLFKDWRNAVYLLPMAPILLAGVVGIATFQDVAAAERTNNCEVLTEGSSIEEASVLITDIKTGNSQIFTNNARVDPDSKVVWQIAVDGDHCDVAHWGHGGFAYSIPRSDLV